MITIAAGSTTSVNGKVPVPPLPLSVAAYAAPAAVSASEEGVMSSVATLTLSTYVLEPLDDCVSVAVTVNVNEPVAPGVPKRLPPADKLSPAGSAPLVTANV